MVVVVVPASRSTVAGRFEVASRVFVRSAMPSDSRSATGGLELGGAPDAQRPLRVLPLERPVGELRPERVGVAVAGRGAEDVGDRPHRVVPQGAGGAKVRDVDDRRAVEQRIHEREADDLRLGPRGHRGQQPPGSVQRQLEVQVLPGVARVGRPGHLARRLGLGDRRADGREQRGVDVLDGRHREGHEARAPDGEPDEAVAEAVRGIGAAELRSELDRRHVGHDADVVAVDDRLLAREDPAHRDAVPGVADHRGERRALAAHDRQQPPELALHDEGPRLALLLVRLEVADEPLA